MGRLDGMVAGGPTCGGGRVCGLGEDDHIHWAAVLAGGPGCGSERAEAKVFGIVLWQGVLLAGLG